MRQITLPFTATLPLLLLACSSLQAATTVSVTGNVTAAGCRLSAADTSKSLVIPSVSAADLSAGFAGGLEGWLNYNASTTLNFTNCPTTVTHVSVNMSSTTGTALGGYNKGAVVPASGSAQGVVLMLAVGSGSNQYLLFADGSNARDFTVQNDGTVTIPVLVGVNAARAFNSAAPAVSAGSYSNTFTLSFTYS
ncbi:fimbrial protein [Enterobacter vonholyi]